ncbi:hypothetical protein CSAL01_09638 [Colletotrichum salicis]|uniref:Uncharacterized protein n=1 Tax=Colletotrichum salicis TaxID=1209931 RepID=A0A135SW62_9PEZI|nr:hypothetical protein CSAL01_09638 [Colletotrichum salicis]
MSENNFWRSSKWFAKPVEKPSFGSSYTELAFEFVFKVVRFDVLPSGHAGALRGWSEAVSSRKACLGRHSNICQRASSKQETVSWISAAGFNRSIAAGSSNTPTLTNLNGGRRPIGPERDAAVSAKVVDDLVAAVRCAGVICRCALVAREGGGGWDEDAYAKGAAGDFPAVEAVAGGLGCGLVNGI